MNIQNFLNALDEHLLAESDRLKNSLHTAAGINPLQDRFNVGALHSLNGVANFVAAFILADNNPIPSKERSE